MLAFYFYEIQKIDKQWSKIYFYQNVLVLRLVVNDRTKLSMECCMWYSLVMQGDTKVRVSTTHKISRYARKRNLEEIFKNAA